MIYETTKKTVHTMPAGKGLKMYQNPALKGPKSRV